MLVLLSLIFVNLSAKPLLCFKVFPTKVKYETVLPEYQHEPEIYRQLYLREKDREETRRQLQEYTRINAAEQALSHYLVYRTASLPDALVFKIQEFLRKMEIVVSDSIIAAGYLYEPPSLFHRWIIGKARMTIFLHPSLHNSITQNRAIAHEIEHIIQAWFKLNHFKEKKDIEPGELRYFLEFGAIRAEFEYLSLLPHRLLMEETALLSTLPSHGVERDFYMNTIRDVADEMGFDAFRKHHIYGSIAKTQRAYDDLQR